MMRDMGEIRVVGVFIIGDPTDFVRVVGNTHRPRIQSHCSDYEIFRQEVMGIIGRLKTE
jgi:hypothetical protein